MSVINGIGSQLIRIGLRLGKQAGLITGNLSGKDQDSQDSVTISTQPEIQNKGSWLKSLVDSVSAKVGQVLEKYLGTANDAPTQSVAKTAAAAANHAIKQVSAEVGAKADKLEARSQNLIQTAQKGVSASLQYIEQRNAIIKDLKDKGFSEEEISRIITTADKKVILNLKGCRELLNRADVLANRVSALRKVQEFLGGVRAVVKITGNDVENLGEVMDGAMTAERNIVSQMTPEEVSQSAQQLAEIDNTLKAIAGNRADLLAKIDAHNNLLANIVVEKVGPTADSPLAEAFISDVNRLRTIFHIVSDITDKVVAMLMENRAEQNRLDKLAAEKLAQKKAIEKKEDEKNADNKIALRKSEIKRQLARLNYDPEKIREINARINEEASKNPVIT